MYRSFRKRFEKRFDLKSDDHVQLEVYLGNRIQHERVKGTVTVDQEHFVLACLEKFGLNRCNGVDKPITSRLSTVRDQPEAVNIPDQELFRGMLVAYSILHHGLDQTLHFLFLSCLGLSRILASRILKQPSAYSDIYKRLLDWDLCIGSLLRFLTILRINRTFYGATSIQIGQAVLTPVALCLVLCSC